MHACAGTVFILFLESIHFSPNSTFGKEQEKKKLFVIQLLIAYVIHFAAVDFFVIDTKHEMIVFAVDENITCKRFVWLLNESAVHM